jgi:hypothetical protein
MPFAKSVRLATLLSMNSVPTNLQTVAMSGDRLLRTCHKHKNVSLWFLGGSGKGVGFRAVLSQCIGMVCYIGTPLYAGFSEGRGKVLRFY